MPSGVARVARVWLQWLQAGEPQERAWSDLGLGEVDVLGWKTGIGGAHWGVPMLSVQPKGKQKGCAGCNRKIKDRYLLKALDKYWHEDCLKCACCDCRLGEVGSTLYTKANLILCRRDYLRLFGTTGNCAACSKLIPAFEMVMRARDNVYHLDCFACQLCNQRFCVGDKFFLKNNMILCQMDYEEGQLNGTFESQVQ
ncbi:rhombotin-1 isoform X4 [Macaca fascicularis]|uniref:rhombotin-1 isoform X2 n=1 Tax=Macaca mulatta TaxID=9544 RepID=UPI0003AB833F|nr:rhombotin-1 isoform X2 [Macaca mulatta]